MPKRKRVLRSHCTILSSALSSMLVALMLLSQTVRAESFNHQLWDGLLQKHVSVLPGGGATQLDYGAVKSARGELSQYLEQLQSVPRVQFDAWSKSEQLAFLINAYNAWTVELILRNYPGVESIRDLGSWFASPWKQAFIPLLGKTVSLDDIEHGLIRGSRRYKEPRIHFAVNCASIGCPALQAQAYRGDALEQQLDRATRQFLSDRSRNRLESGELQVSKIFKWYREDFEAGWLNADSLAEFLSGYAAELGLSDRQVRLLLDGDIDIEFLDYDWKLNDRS